MPYQIDAVEFKCFPSDAAVEQALVRAQLSVESIVEVIRAFVCEEELTPGTGYQTALAKRLEDYLSQVLVKSRLRERAARQYSPRLNEAADVAIEVAGDGRRIFIEIEFRPNVEKDLVKFQIGANTGRLLIGILVLAIDRSAINARYTTMPEYRKFVSVIEELRPTYPLLLIGIQGDHSAAAI